MRVSLFKAVAGIVISGLFIALLATGLVERVRSAKVVRELRESSRDLRARERQFYDPKTGFTNTDFESIDRIQNQLHNASHALSGDDAAVAKVFSDYVGHVSDLAKTYHQRVSELREAKVLAVTNLSSKNQIAGRREVVLHFMAASQSMKDLSVSGEGTLCSNLTAAGVSQEVAKAAMQGFNRRRAPRRDLELTIRDCDERVGKSTLAVLGILETNWGQWRYDDVRRKLIFKNTAALKSYQSEMAELQQARQDQVAAQGQLVNIEAPSQ